MILLLFDMIGHAGHSSNQRRPPCIALNGCLSPLMGFAHHEPGTALLWESAEKFVPGLANPGWDHAHRARIAGEYGQHAPDRHASHFTNKFHEGAGAEAAPCIDLFLNRHIDLL